MSIAPRNKIYLWILCLAIFTGMFFTFNASAQEGLNFTLAIDPSTMTKPGQVKVTVRLANSGQSDITTPLSLYDADDKLVTDFFDGGSLSTLKAGDVRTWEGNAAIKQPQLDAGKVIYTIKYSAIDQAGAVSGISVPAEATINYTGEKVDLSIKRTITPEVVRKDGLVTVLYELTNNGNVQLTDIKIREHGSISTSTQQLKTLEPGAHATLKFEKKASTTDLESHPNITYKKEGDKKLFKATLESAIIPAAKPKFKSTLTVDKNMINIGETVVLTLTMQNDGNVSYSNIKVKDAKLGEVFTGLNVPARQTVTQTKEVTVMQSESYQFELHLEDNTGKSQDEKTEAVKISAYDPAKMIRLNVELSADYTSIPTLPGTVKFSVIVTNNSDFAVEGIRLAHGETTIHSIGKLEPGQSINITRDYLISREGRYQFTASVRDSQKNIQEFKSNEMEISYIPATPKPTAEPLASVPPLVTLTPVPEAVVEQSGGQMRNTIYMATLGVAVIFTLVFLLFIASTVVRIKRRVQSKSAYDHFELGQKRDFADVTTYTEQEKAQTGESATARPEQVEMPHEKYLKPDTAKEQQDEPDTAEAEEETTVSTESETLPTSDEEGGYTLTRDQDEGQEKTERRGRRSSKHHDNS